MGDRSRIEWTQATWNPVTGCSKVSPGCAHCYAEAMALRLKAAGVPRYSQGFEITLHPDLLETPKHWTRPRLVFVNSMSDLYHESVPLQFIRQIFEVMAECDQHTFQILTKRPERLTQIAALLTWPSNVWQGVSVENKRFTHRVDLLRQIPAAVRFLSVEPLLGPIGPLDLNGIHWVIVGGESGPAHRSMAPEWAREVRDQCIRARVPFFFKQWGGRTPKAGGRMLDGRIWDEMPKTGQH